MDTTYMTVHTKAETSAIGVDQHQKIFKNFKHSILVLELAWLMYSCLSICGATKAANTRPSLA